MTNPMAAHAVRDVGRSLLRDRHPRRVGVAVDLCARCRPLLASLYSTTTTTPGTPAPAARALPVPMRKQLKEEARARKAAGVPRKGTANRGQTVSGWELTVGIEIHAQLNTARKLFSAAAGGSSPSSAPGSIPGSGGSAPNTQVAFFDLALPGAQPIFQAATLVPAIRAALALRCDVQRVSRFDRKHYFHWDQPSGYQITQFYEPFARRGHVDLYARDGIAAEDGDHVRVDIVQVQMEQDTAKTVAQPGGAHWLDFNRVGMPLIEIITAPQLHHPATAAALVRKIQVLLAAVDACTSGMEAGGLRADVNVSVRRVLPPADAAATRAPAPAPAPLGVRTEIKNLNSFRAVEDAIIAERNRQIAAIEAAEASGLSSAAAAQVIVSETRGWVPPSSGGIAGTTRRLRGKEGEVDYRYMPDPDLGPVIIDDSLVRFLQLTLGVSPDDELESLVADYGLSATDAAALMLLDNGGRAQYYYDVVDGVEERLRQQQQPDGSDGSDGSDTKAVRAFVANWVLHRLGHLTSERNAMDAASVMAAAAPSDLEMTPEGRCRIPVACLADILAYHYAGRITANVAKDLLFAVFRGDVGVDRADALYADVTAAIEQGGLWFDEIGPDDYAALAEQALAGEDKTLRLFVDAALRPSPKKKYPQGKLQFLIGKLLRLGPEGRTDPRHAEAAVRAAIGRRVDDARQAAGTTE